MGVRVVGVCEGLGGGGSFTAFKKLFEVVGGKKKQGRVLCKMISLK